MALKEKKTHTFSLDFYFQKIKKKKKKKKKGGQPLPSFVSTLTALLPSFNSSSTSSSSASSVPVATKTILPCGPNKAGNALATAITGVAGALAATRVPPFAPRPQPLFARANSSGGGSFIFSNPDSAYLSALVAWVPGRLAVFRGTMFQ